MTVHKPVVAGTFYPAEPAALQAMAHQLVAEAPAIDVPQPKALVLPHAGYRFSGAVAAAGISALGEGISRVVLLGPSHHHAFQGVALPAAEALETPLGTVPVDTAATAQLLRDPDVAVVPAAFAREHAVEVELPFLQHRLGEISVVPLVVGEIVPARLAQILDGLWGGAETLIVISTDLTHLLTAQRAVEIDLTTAAAIEQTASDALTAREACGHRPLAAFLQIAARRGMRLTRLALSHSGVVTGDTARVVGYGAWMAHEQEAARLSAAHRFTLLRVARQALLGQVRSGKAPVVDLSTFPAPLHSIAASFVTLTLEGRLRGCIGSLRAHQPLAQDVVSNAVKAGFRDPRFKPVSEDEVARADIEVAVLSAPTALAFDNEAALRAQLRPGRDGLILSDGVKRATFLPKVWEALDTPEAFLAGLKVKAGMARDHWSETLEVRRYVTETFTGRVRPPA